MNQESLFYWVADSFEDVAHLKWREQPVTKEFRFTNYQSQDKAVSAFTVAELGEMLPWMLDLGCSTGEKMYWLHLGKNGKRPALGKEWTVFYEEPPNEVGESECIPWPTLDAETEADARAQMLIYLLENNYQLKIPPPESSQPGA